MSFSDPPRLWRCSLRESDTIPCGCRAPITDCTRLTAHCAACDCVILKVETQSAGRQQHVAPVIASSQQQSTDMEQGGRSQLAHLSLFFSPIHLGNIRPSITPGSVSVQNIMNHAQHKSVH